MIKLVTLNLKKNCAFSKNRAQLGAIIIKIRFQLVLKLYYYSHV